MANKALQLTVLTTLGVNAVKTYRQVGKKLEVEGYGRAKTFTAETIDVDRKGRWLEKLRPRRHSFVVLGEPKDWKRGEKKRRLSSDRDGDEATIQDVPRGWMPVDVDQVDFVPMLGVEDGESFALELLDRLKIRGISCVWHLTNSHGFFDKHRARLWLELATPATAAQMKEWAKSRWGDLKVDVDGKQKNVVDMSVYQCQQPIYTGDPILIGVESPVERRVGFVEGDALELRLPKESKRKARNGAPEDKNIEILEEAGLYIRQLKPGQHMIECPWEEVHTGESRDDDTFYFEPHHNGHDIPAFKCHHDSCSEKKWSDVLDFVGEHVEPDDTDDERSPNWVYVHRMKTFWDARDGAMIDREMYDSTMAGVKGKGKPSERFLAMKRSEKCDVAEFLPGQERFIQKGKVRVLNTYIDQRVVADPGIDVTPWTDHLAWLIPNEKDRERLMDWLAWCYQRPGEKITWSPILYSRAYGVGKTTVFDCLAECVGKVMVSEPTQAELEDKFNDWCYSKLLVKIEELMSGDKFHVAEKLKPIVANPTISVRRMHQTGFVVANVANVCASTNHMQALPIERGDRRWMLIQCVEAEKEERRPRMKAFHRWLAEVGHGGIAHWLSQRDVGEFQPKGEAPMTSLKEVVMQASLTDFERAIELCDVFDKAGIISSAMVSEYLLQNECKVSDRKLGLIANRRGWISPGGADRCRALVGNRKMTFWVSKGTPTLKLTAFLNKKPGERERIHNNMVAKNVFGNAETSEADEVL